MTKEAKILIVEDTIHLQILAKRFLENAGFGVITSGDGEEALRALQLNSDVRLIFLDIMMPKMDGTEFLKRIRPLKEQMNLRICMMTAKEGTEDVKDCLRSGADDYLIKPIDELLLVDKTKILLQEKDVNNFSLAKCDFEGGIELPNGRIPIHVSLISEGSLAFSSDVQLPLGARVHLTVPRMEPLLGNKSFLLRIYRSERDGIKFKNCGSYIGLKEHEYKRLRSVSTRGVENA